MNTSSIAISINQDVPMYHFQMNSDLISEIRVYVNVVVFVCFAVDASSIILDVVRKLDEIIAVLGACPRHPQQHARGKKSPCSDVRAQPDTDKRFKCTTLVSLKLLDR